MRKIVLLILLLAAAPLTSQAETVYVTDKFYINIYTEQSKDSPVIKTIGSGAALEVLERTEEYVLVRDRPGNEGWIETRFLSTTPSAQLRLNDAVAQLEKNQRQLAVIKRKLNDSEAKLSRVSVRARVWEKKATEAAAGQNKAGSRIGGPAGARQAPADKTDGQGDEPASGLLLWLVSFAMLVIGFIGGVLWLREINRRRLGGMHLRI